MGLQVSDYPDFLKRRVEVSASPAQAAVTSQFGRAAGATVGGVALGAGIGLLGSIFTGIVGGIQARKQRRQQAKAAKQQRKDWLEQQKYERRQQKKREQVEGRTAAFNRSSVLFDRKMAREEVNKETLGNAMQTINSVVGDNLDFNNYLQGLFT